MLSGIFSLQIKEWNRKKINSYWLIISLLFLGVLSGLIFENSSAEYVYYYVIHYIVIPHSFLVVLVISLEILNRKGNSLNDYVFIVTDSIIPFIIIGIFSGHDGLHLILIASIIVSAFYFDKKKVLMSCILNISLFFLLYTFIPDLREGIDVFEVISTVIVYLGAYAIAIGLMNRGTFLINSLSEKMKSEQDLIIKNVLMDRTTKIDALTELYNHKTFYEYLDRIIEQSEAHQVSFQLGIIDIDDFKSVNDTYGHWVGDIIIKRVSYHIRNSVSPQDIVSRYGGEEFSVIFTEKTNEQAQQIAEDICINMSKMKHNELNGRSITLSIGLQSYQKGTGKERLFRAADACLYLAKKTGKNKVVTKC